MKNESIKAFLAGAFETSEEDFDLAIDALISSGICKDDEEAGIELGHRLWWQAYAFGSDGLMNLLDLALAVVKDAASDGLYAFCGEYPEFTEFDIDDEGLLVEFSNDTVSKINAAIMRNGLDGETLNAPATHCLAICRNRELLARPFSSNGNTLRPS